MHQLYMFQSALCTLIERRMEVSQALSTRGINIYIYIYIRVASEQFNALNAVKSSLKAKKSFIYSYLENEMSRYTWRNASLNTRIMYMFYNQKIDYKAKRQKYFDLKH